MIKARLMIPVLFLALTVAVPAARAEGTNQYASGEKAPGGSTNQKREDPRNCRPWCLITADD